MGSGPPKNESKSERRLSETLRQAANCMFRPFLCPAPCWSPSGSRQENSGAAAAPLFSKVRHTGETGDPVSRSALRSHDQRDLVSDARDPSFFCDTFTAARAKARQRQAFSSRAAAAGSAGHAGRSLHHRGARLHPDQIWGDDRRRQSPFHCSERRT